jgi:hypothetical protein
MVGAGRTVNISSTGALVSTQQPISVGAQVALFVDWPILLDGTVPLQFFTVGEVVRSDAGVFALSFKRYHFRTARKQPKSVSENEGYREVG